jgi:DME family drug/metabolite transporter
MFTNLAAEYTHSMDKLDTEAKPAPQGLSPVAVGTICGLLAAIGYTATNTCLKQLADSNLNAFWISAVKAFPTLLICAPWALFQSRIGLRVMPEVRVFWLLLLCAIVGQIGGNVGFQVGLEYVGLGISVAICLGTIQIFGAILGRIFLTEAITIRAIGAMVLLFGALGSLSMGAKMSVKPHTPWEIAIGIASLCASGFAYAVIGVAIRYGVTGRTTIAYTLSIIGCVGVVCLGSIAWWNIGLSGMAATTVDQWSAMLVAGLLNALSFLALTKAYQATTVTYVAIMNACQTAMAALIGVLLFQEQWSASLVVGLILTAAGVLMMALKRGTRRPK